MIVLPGFTCKTCIFWERQKDEYADSSDASAYRLGLGRCRKATEMWESTDFRNSKSEIKSPERALPTFEFDHVVDGDPILIEKDSTLQMYVQDGSGYHAYLYTKPDFFCAHHELKSETNP